MSTDSPGLHTSSAASEDHLGRGQTPQATGSPSASEPVPVAPASEDHTTATPETPATGQDWAGNRAGPRAPTSSKRPQDRRKPPPRRRRKARRVHRVVHHFDIWSVAKVSGVFAACGYLVTMISGYLLWQVGDRVGTIEGVEGFMEDTGGYDTFIIDGDVIFRVAAFVGVVAAILVVCLAILGAILFNLISDLTGGIRMTVIDEDLIVTPARRQSGPSGS